MAKTKKIKVIVKDGVVETVLANNGPWVDVEIVDMNKDYEDYDALVAYEKKLYADTSLKEIPFTTASFLEEAEKA